MDFQESQALVKQQILSQLTAIGDRLQKLEDKPVKKTADRSKVKGTRVTKPHKSTRVNKTKSTRVKKVLLQPVVIVVLSRVLPTSLH